jgi:hypothetical protein
VSMPRAASRVMAVIMAVLVALVGASVTQPAEASSGRLLQPNEAFGIAAGLADASGDLALQCLMGKIGDRVRGGTPVTRLLARQ